MVNEKDIITSTIPLNVPFIEQFLRGIQKMELGHEKNSALFNLVARVAHDISSPIAVMEMGLYQIEKTHVKKDTTILRIALQRIRDITNNLLDQYRDQSAPQFIFIKTLLEEVVFLKRYEWREKNCELTSCFNTISEFDQVIGIATEIKRLLSNLLNNAIEACKQNANIQVTANKVDGDIEISISDNGTGISAEKISRYLDGESSKHSGVGLGLSSAKQYMEKISGELLVISELAIGTTIKLKFRADAKLVRREARADETAI